VAGIGDTPSDQIMLEKLAWFGSPANAAPEIRERASFVAERTEAAGVVQILERLSCV
jgi:hypothetical protein